ncbi:MAG: hypothetical protein QXE51_02635 [Nitrososphaeria archaeon]
MPFGVTIAIVGVVPVEELFPIPYPVDGANPNPYTWLVDVIHNAILNAILRLFIIFIAIPEAGVLDEEPMFM